MDRIHKWAITVEENKQNSAFDDANQPDRCIIGQDIMHDFPIDN